MTPVLAQRVRADRSFERIYRRHLGDVYRYSFAVLRNQADAEDVTQTTFLNAYRAFQKGERPRNPQNWLIAIAHNVCRQRFRQSQRRPDEIEYDDAISEVVPEEDHGPSAEDIQRALGHLAFNQRAALVMRELEGRSYIEIAEILDLSVSAVETLLFRARRALREQLEGSLTCVEAERAISLQTDGKLPRAERGALRAHVRECEACERLARSHRAQRKAFKALAMIPIPSSLTSLFGGGGAAVGVGAGAKAAAVIAAGVVATGAGYEGTKLVEHRAQPPANASAAIPAAPAARVQTPTPVAVSVARVEARRATPVAATPVPAARESKPAAKPAAKPKQAEHAVPPGQAKKAERAAAAAPAAPAPKRAKPVPPGHVKQAVRVKARPAARPEKARPARAVKAPPAHKKAAPAPAPAAPSPPQHEPKGRGPKLVELPALPVPVPPVTLP